ncbi:MAG: leucine-rich repeat domain-containing protein [Bacteroidales bacterium]|nr:leucine-rich repeat domain-containing protein [Bacteroidales bacterium]
MKKIKCMVLFACLLSALTVQAFEFTVGKYRYYTTGADNSTVCLSGYVLKPSWKMVLPSSVEYEGKNYLVTSLGDNAFNGCQDFNRIIFPEHLISIGNGTFKGCDIYSLSFPSSLTSIGDSAFKSIGYVSSIVLPQHLILIGDEAFEGCIGLTSIDIPSSTVSIGKNVFAKCTILREVYVRNASPSIVGKSIFSGIDRSLCALYVPIGSKDVFATADGWKDFQSIEETVDKSEYTYRPFIMDGTCEWQSLEWKMGADKPDVNRRVISNEDSVYQGRTYKIIYDYPSCSVKEEDRVYVGLIREEDKRVYYAGSPYSGITYDTEKLLYDFNMNVGDSMYYCRVSRIDTIQRSGVWLREYSFIYGDGDDCLDFIIEGIGCLNFNGITDPLNPGFTSTFPWVQCVLHGDNILYKGYCPCSSLTSQPFVEDVGRISFYVRDRQLCIHAPNQPITTLKIYTLDGKLIKSVTLAEQMDEITCSLEEFSPGSYLFIVGSADSQQSGQFIVQ